MAWLKFDDGVPNHPKLLKAGPLAAWLWFSGVCYCRRYLTDGAIPHEALAGLVPSLKKPRAEAERLVLAGLWYATEDGYRVHDFHDWNPTRESVESERKVDRDRKRLPTGIQTERSHAGAGVSVSPSSSVSESGISPGSERARENQQAAAPLLGRRNLDLMTYGPVKLWASQFRDDILPLVATHYGGDRDAADGPARAWVGELDTANQATTPNREALAQPAKWWASQAIARWASSAPASGTCQGCGNPDGQCADVKVCNARWLEQQKAAKVSA